MFQSVEMTIKDRKKNKKNRDKKESESHIPESLNNISEIVNDIVQFLPPQTENRSFFTSFLCSIFEPGVNSSLMTVIHGSFLSLIAVHFWLIYLTEGKDVHIWALMLINMLLYPSLLIFIHLAYNKN